MHPIFIVMSSLALAVLSWRFVERPFRAFGGPGARSGCEQFNSKVFDVIRQLDVRSVIFSTRRDLLRARGVEGLRETVARLSETGIRIVDVRVRSENAGDV